MNTAPMTAHPHGDEEPQELSGEQRASMKARLREMFGGEPPAEMLNLAAQRERQFEDARAAAQ
ncbi:MULTISPECIES: hypothetical protein [unclassified Nonomuraea]|uniref:hypothetical protein n=1 Tax=unclassified Nonomuraea TaxID=2593643 RepID=UPI0033D9FAAF